MLSNKGHRKSLSPFRRLVCDMMHFSGKVPSNTAERRLELAEVVAARQACEPRPSWCMIFVKAFAVVAARHPDLRTSLLTFPWSHLYVHPENFATLVVEREYRDESILLNVQVPYPDRLSLQELDTLLRFYKEEPLENVGLFRKQWWLGMSPWPVRHLIFWGGLNLSGRLRAFNFGTFGITSVAAQGAGLTRLIPLLTTTLHYGMFDDRGALDMRLSFDHRVYDAARAARALVELEQVLQTDIAAELRAMRSPAVELSLPRLVA
jgi:hypothetical protein